MCWCYQKPERSHGRRLVHACRRWTLFYLLLAFPFSRHSGFFCTLLTPSMLSYNQVRHWTTLRNTSSIIRVPATASPLAQSHALSGRLIPAVIRRQVARNRYSPRLLNPYLSFCGTSNNRRLEPRKFFLVKYRKYFHMYLIFYPTDYSSTTVPLFKFLSSLWNNWLLLQARVFGTFSLN